MRDCQAPADYATANPEHHQQWSSSKNLMKGQGDRRASQEGRIQSSPPKPLWCWKAAELHRRNKSDEASVTAGIAQQGPVFVLWLIFSFLKFQVLSTTTHHGE